MHNLFKSADQIESIVARIEAELTALSPDEMTKGAYSSCIEILQDLLTLADLLKLDDAEPEDADKLSIVSVKLSEGVIDAQAKSYTSDASREIIQRLSTAVSSILTLYYVATLVDR